MNKLNQDIDESKISESEIEEIDFDVKEAFRGKSDFIEVESKCQTYKNATDVTCCQLKK